MTTMTAEDAMRLALADTAPVENIPQAPADPTPATQPASTPVGPHTGPLTSEQAEKLLAKAFRAATSFADVMKQIIVKKAWEPLGYSDPRHMMKERFIGKLVNPQTGEPFSDGHIRRMANVAWVVWSLSENTGMDPKELHISAYALARIPSGLNGTTHDELVQTVLDEVERRGADTVEEVQEIMDATLEASTEAGAVTLPTEPPSDPADEDDRPLPQGLLTSEPPLLGSNDPGPSRDDGFEDRYGPDGNPDDWQEQTSTPKTSAADTFEEDFGQGSKAPTPSVSMDDALDMMRKAEQATDDVATLVGFPAELHQAVQDITRSLPAVVKGLNTVLEAGRSAVSVSQVGETAGLFDGLSEQELDHLQEQVAQAIEVTPTVQALAAVLNAAADHPGGLPGVGGVSAAAKLCEESADVLGKLEEFLDEIDFATQAF